MCRGTYLHLDGRRAPAGGDAVLRPDPRRAPRGARDVRHGARRPYLAPRCPTSARRLFEAGVTSARHVGHRPDRSRRSDRARRRRRCGWRRSGACTARAGARRGRQRALPADVGRRRAASSRGASSSTSRIRAVSTTARWRPRRSRSDGSWTRLATVGPGSRFTEPTVVDVDFPNVALTEAWWDAQQQTLFVTPEPVNPRGLPSRRRSACATSPTPHAGASSSTTERSSSRWRAARRWRCARRRRRVVTGSSAAPESPGGVYPNSRTINLCSFAFFAPILRAMPPDLEAALVGRDPRRPRRARRRLPGAQPPSPALPAPPRRTRGRRPCVGGVARARAPARRLHRHDREPAGAHVLDRAPPGGRRVPAPGSHARPRADRRGGRPRRPGRRRNRRRRSS